AHGIGDGADYEAIFSKLSRIRRQQRVVTISGIVIGFPIVAKHASGYFLQVTEGDPDAVALVFNTSTGDTREAALDDTEVFSQATHLFVAPGARRAAVEY